MKTKFCATVLAAATLLTAVPARADFTLAFTQEDDEGRLRFRKSLDATPTPGEDWSGSDTKGPFGNGGVTLASDAAGVVRLLGYADSKDRLRLCTVLGQTVAISCGPLPDPQGVYVKVDSPPAVAFMEPGANSEGLWLVAFKTKGTHALSVRVYNATSMTFLPFDLAAAPLAGSSTLAAQFAQDEIVLAYRRNDRRALVAWRTGTDDRSLRVAQAQVPAIPISNSSSQKGPSWSWTAETVARDTQPGFALATNQTSFTLSLQEMKTIVGKDAKGGPTQRFEGHLVVMSSQTGSGFARLPSQLPKVTTTGGPVTAGARSTGGRHALAMNPAGDVFLVAVLTDPEGAPYQWADVAALFVAANGQWTSFTDLTEVFGGHAPKTMNVLGLIETSKP